MDQFPLSCEMYRNSLNTCRYTNNEINAKRKKFVCVKFRRKLINERRSIVFGKIGILLLYETRWHNESRDANFPRTFS